MSTTRKSGSGPSGDRLRSRTVYDTLRSRIASGELQPGELITEAALAEQFGVSRTPIREAIKFLAWEGLLERSDRDMRVRVLDLNEVVDIYEVRIALEETAARAAAIRRTEFDLALLRGRLEELEQLDPKAVDRRPEVAYNVHFAMWSATHNQTLIEALERLQLVVVSHPSTTLHYPDRWAELSQQCRDLVQAVADRDPDRAQVVVNEHLTNARDARIRLYSANARPPAPASIGAF